MISVGRYRFNGPFYGESQLRQTAGVYAILDQRADGLFVIDIGESENIQQRILNHDRAACWAQNRRGAICYAVLYLPGRTVADRRSIEKELRHSFQPSCGVN